MLLSARSRNRLSRVTGLATRCFVSTAIVGHVNADTIKSRAVIRDTCL